MNEFIELVREMRKEQKHYKLFRTIDAKERCYILECKVDSQLKNYIEKDKNF